MKAAIDLLEWHLENIKGCITLLEEQKTQNINILFKCHQDVDEIQKALEKLKE